MEVTVLHQKLPNISWKPYNSLKSEHDTNESSNQSSIVGRSSENICSSSGGARSVREKVKGKRLSDLQMQSKFIALSLSQSEATAATIAHHDGRVIKKHFSIQFQFAYLSTTVVHFLNCYFSYLATNNLLGR
jgi:mannitol-specific phosphotransferase system IIBC component